MKITKQRLREIIKEEIEYVGAEIEDVPEPPEPAPSSPSAEAMTVTRPFLAMTDEFADYLAANEIPSEYDAIKQHLLDLGLPRTAAGIYALYGMESHGGMEESKVSSKQSEVTYAREKRGKSKKPEKKAYNKAARAQAKRDLKKSK